jgi:hypothetical protein
LEVPTYVLWHGFNSVKNDKSSAISVACYGILFDGFELFGTPRDPDEITKSSRDSLKGGNNNLLQQSSIFGDLSSRDLTTLYVA